MASDEHQRTETEHRRVDGVLPGSVDRRTVLKASAATGAAGMLAGCTGGVLPASDQAPADAGTPATQGHGCPEIAGVEDGLVWVKKQAASPWTASVMIAGSEPYASGEDDLQDVRGTANIGHGKLEFHEPGEYTFLYEINPGDLTWVEPLDSLMAVAFRDEPYARNGLVVGDDIVDYSVYPYAEDHPLSMTFRIDEPGTYRIAYGPADGAFLFEEWLPDLHQREDHLLLGVGIEGDESGYSWVFPEVPEHVIVWFGDEEMAVSQEPHPPDIECEFDIENYR